MLTGQNYGNLCTKKNTHPIDVFKIKRLSRGSHLLCAYISNLCTACRAHSQYKLSSIMCIDYHNEKLCFFTFGSLSGTHPQAKSYEML